MVSLRGWLEDSWSYYYNLKNRYCNQYLPNTLNWLLQLIVAITGLKAHPNILQDIIWLSLVEISIPSSKNIDFDQVFYKLYDWKINSFHQKIPLFIFNKQKYNIRFAFKVDSQNSAPISFSPKTCNNQSNN